MKRFAACWWRCWTICMAIWQELELTTISLRNSWVSQSAHVPNAEWETVRQALAKMSAEQRSVITLRYGTDLEDMDTQQVLGWPAGTVNTPINRMRERLRVLLHEAQRS